MDPYITQQLLNMKASVRLIQQNIHWAVRDDNSYISRQEGRVVLKMDKAVTKFLKELDRLSE